MVASDFDGLGGYRTLEYEGQVPIKPYSSCFSRVFQASVCIATYGMSVPSLHTESTDSVILIITQCTSVTFHYFPVSLSPARPTSGTAVLMMWCVSTR